MVTITIKNDIKLSRKEFVDLDDLHNFIESERFKIKNTIQANEIGKELDRRYNDLIIGDLKGVALEDVKVKYLKRISK